MLCVKTWKDCIEAGKNIKTIRFQTQHGKLPRIKNVNDESSIDFAGSFKIAISTKKYLVVSFESETSWSAAKLLR